MANLSIAAVCNRACDYCFARSVMAEYRLRTPWMAMDTYARALDFLQRSGIDQVRLLGGEPTLHCSLPEMVGLALQRGLRVLIFSGGVMPESVLGKLETVPVGRLAVLVNVPSPHGMEVGRRGAERGPPDLSPGSSAGLASLRAALQRLGTRVTLGVNIERAGLELDFLLDWIEQYGLARCIRLGLTHPCLDGSNRFLHARHYEAVGRDLALLAEKAAALGVSLEFDCGLVPCMFPPGLIEALGKTPADVGRRCNPVLDILPDGQVVSCYPLAGLHREPLPDQRDAAWLGERFRAVLSPYRTLGIFPRCATCDLRAAGDCQGGCLAAAMGRLRRGVGFQPAGTATSLPWKQTANPPRDNTWIIPYVDQPLDFWDRLDEEFGPQIGEVYFPLPGGLVGSGRPVQPAAHLETFLRRSRLRRSVLVNPLALPGPVDAVAPRIIDVLRRLVDRAAIRGATISSLPLAERIREAVPELPLTASVLMDVASPDQASQLNGLFDALVPASRVMRDLAALGALRAAFRGRIRLMVNEACLPGCPDRRQHFREMADPTAWPASLCDDCLRREPWRRLTGAWVLPQHLHLFQGLHDELKLAGRVTLRDPAHYMQVLSAYVHGRPLTPDAIGGGPASVEQPLEISEEFFLRTLHCNRQCDRCSICRDYHATMTQFAGGVGQ